jgi:hypothetical protein
MWKTITGEEVGRSSLPNRYARIKANISVFPDEDSVRLVKAKKEVEEDFEKNKWTLIKDGMEKMGVTTNYQVRHHVQRLLSRPTHSFSLLIGLVCCSPEAMEETGGHRHQCSAR